MIFICFSSLPCCNFIKFCFWILHPAIRASLALASPCSTSDFPTTAVAVSSCFWPTCFGSGGEERREYLMLDPSSSQTPAPLLALALCSLQGIA